MNVSVFCLINKLLLLIPCALSYELFIDENTFSPYNPRAATSLLSALHGWRPWRAGGECHAPGHSVSMWCGQGSSTPSDSMLCVGICHQLSTDCLFSAERGMWVCPSPEFGSLILHSMCPGTFFQASSSPRWFGVGAVCTLQPFGFSSVRPPTLQSRVTDNALCNPANKC